MHSATTLYCNRKMYFYIAIVPIVKLLKIITLPEPGLFQKVSKLKKEESSVDVKILTSTHAILPYWFIFF